MRPASLPDGGHGCDGRSRRAAAPAGKAGDGIACCGIADGIAGDVDGPERREIRLELRIDFENDAILVGLAINCRDLPLAEGIVERIVQRLHRDAEPARDNAVGLDHHGVAVFLNVG